MTYGFSSEGFEVKPQYAIEEEKQQYMRDNFKAGYTLRSDTADGQILKLNANAEAIIWQQLEALYFSFILSYAEGVHLDNLMELRGLRRKGATKSTVTVIVYGDEGTIISSGFIISTTTGNKFEITETVTIPSSGYINTTAESLEYGQIEAPAGTLTVIETPILGWSSVTNALDATLGQLQETDTEFRERAELELGLGGNSTINAIRSNLLELSNVTNVSVKENDKSVEDTEGRPPKSFEVIIEGGDNQDIAKKILEVKACGIETCSTTLKDIIPTMTSNTTPEGTASAGSEAVGYEAYKAMDDNDSTYWGSNSTTSDYLIYQLLTAQNILVFTLKSVTEESSPRDFTLEGSNNGSDYDILSTYTDIEFGDNEKKEFIVPYYNNTYTYFKINITENSGGSDIKIAEFELLPFKKVINVNDSEETPHSIIFSRPELINIYVSVDIQKSPSYPTNGDSLVKDLIVEYGNNLSIGDDVEATALYCPVYSLNSQYVGAIIKATNIKVGLSPSPTLDEIVIQNSQKAYFDINRIVINTL